MLRMGTTLVVSRPPSITLFSHSRGQLLARLLSFALLLFFQLGTAGFQLFHRSLQLRLQVIDLSDSLRFQALRCSLFLLFNGCELLFQLCLQLSKAGGDLHWSWVGSRRDKRAARARYQGYAWADCWYHTADSNGARSNRTARMCAANHNAACKSTAHIRAARMSTAHIGAAWVRAAWEHAARIGAAWVSTAWKDAAWVSRAGDQAAAGACVDNAA